MSWETLFYILSMVAIMFFSFDSGTRWKSYKIHEALKHGGEIVVRWGDNDQSKIVGQSFELPQ